MSDKKVIFLQNVAISKIEYWREAINAVEEISYQFLTPVACTINVCDRNLRS
jgi:hypothetical protein